MYVLLETKDVLDGEVKALMHAFPQKVVLDEIQIKYGGENKTGHELLTIVQNVQERASITRSESLLMSTIVANDDKTKKRVMEVTAQLTAKVSRPWHEVIDSRVATMAQRALAQPDSEARAPRADKAAESAGPKKRRLKKKDSK